jgi:hypothetical protein
MLLLEIVQIYDLLSIHNTPVAPPIFSEARFSWGSVRAVFRRCFLDSRDKAWFPTPVCRAQLGGPQSAGCTADDPEEHLVYLFAMASREIVQADGFNPFHIHLYVELCRRYAVSDQVKASDAKMGEG